MTTDAPDLRYPIGRFNFDEVISEQQLAGLIDDIEQTPERFRTATASLSPEQLDTPYRPGGWTVRQVVHHVPDSHLNAYVRFRLALTEDQPTIRPYREERWAELPDARNAPLELSLSLLDALHRRWVLLLRNLTQEDLNRSFNHPALGTVRLDKNIGLYAWHGRHHLAHITSLKTRMGWS